MVKQSGTTIIMKTCSKNDKHMRRHTIIDLIYDDPEALVRLLREVYSKGLNDGVVANKGDDFDCDAVFHEWDAVEPLLDEEVGSIEDFVDLLFDARC